MMTNLTRRAAVVTAVAALSFSACGGDDESATTDSSASPTSETDDAPASTVSESVLFTSPAGDFSVMLPGQPQANTQESPLPDGTTLPVTFWSVALGSGSLTVGRVEYPAGLVTDPWRSLQGAQDQAITNLDGTVVFDGEIELQGRPGREFTATVTSGGVEGTVVARLYLDGDVQVQLLATGPGELSPDDEAIAAFFDSFAFST